MTAPSDTLALPRFFEARGYQVNAYKAFLVLGICTGTLTAAGVADVTGYRPLPTGVAAMVSGLAGLVGARIYHVLAHAREYFQSRHTLWDAGGGGMGLFGSLLTFIPVSVAAALWIGTPIAVLWDQMAVGVLAGGFWIRFGCAFNGCCGGRQTTSRLGVRLHDSRGVVQRRIPVQFLEQAWWLLGLIAYLVAWPAAQPAGSAALAVLVFYGAGRFVLEPLREQSDLIWGRVRLNQLIAALLAIGAGSALVALQSW